MTSLLFLEGFKQGLIDKQTLYHLQLDRAIKKLSSNKRQIESFINILSQPLLTAEEIIYRQEILKDFLAAPQLLDNLMEHFSMFKAIKEQFDVARRENARYFSGSFSNGERIGTLNLLKIYAIILKKELILLKKINQNFVDYSTNSDGLQRLHDAIDRICSTDEFNVLLQMCTYFEYVNSSEPTNIFISFNEKGRVCACNLCQGTNSIKTQLRNGKRFLKIKKNYVNDECVKISIANNTTFQQILTVPYKEIINYIECIVKQIFSSFNNCYDECVFYHIATTYYNFVSKIGGDLVFPQITQSENMSIKGLKDLLLVLDANSSEEIVANDYTKKKNCYGTVIFGKNGGGKTVFIRAIATAQIFAQSGLPILAENATLQCFANILTLYSGAEKKAVEDSAGRFEQEVADMKQLVEKATNQSLILLNEVFQSTNYDEGAECLAGILDYFSAIGVSWLLVTHLHQIKENINKNVVYVNAFDEYKIY